MKGFKTLFLVFKIQIGTRKNSFKIYTQFRNAPSKSFKDKWIKADQDRIQRTTDVRPLVYWLCWAAGFSHIIYGRRMYQRELYFMKMGKLRKISTLGDGYRRFEDTCCLRLRDRTALLSCRIAKQRGFSETFVTIEHRTRRHVPEDNILFIHRDEILKSHTMEVYFVYVVSIGRLGKESFNWHVINFLLSLPFINNEREGWN
jgi:hypothetical protein